MSQIKAVFTGGIVAEPEVGETPSGAKRLTFPVYINHTKKNKETGAYDKTGDVSKVRVTLWGDLAASADVQKGDLVEVTATLIEKEFAKKDGTTGRSLQTDWVESVVVKARSNNASNSGNGFADNDGF